MGIFGNKRKTDGSASDSLTEVVWQCIAQAKIDNDLQPVNRIVFGSDVMPGTNDNEYLALRFIRMLISDRYNIVDRKDMNASLAISIMSKFYNVPEKRGAQIYRQHGP